MKKKKTNKKKQRVVVKTVFLPGSFVGASGSGSVETSGRSSSTDCGANKKVTTSKRYI